MQVIPSVCVVALQHDAEALQLYNHVISLSVVLTSIQSRLSKPIVGKSCGQVT